jgi:hypothetical protein
VTIGLAERPDAITNILRLFAWLAVLQVVPIGELEILDGQLVGGEIRDGGAGPESPGEIFRQARLLLCLALLGTVPTHVVILAGESDHSSA